MSEARIGESVLETSAGDFALQDYRLREGGREWTILHTGAVLTDEDETRAIVRKTNRLPYGVALWPSAIALAHELALRGDLAGKTVLELGAGTGLPGIVAATLGARVVQTDRDELSLGLCRRNGERNNVAIEYRLADFTTWEEAGTFDLIIGADILYGDSLLPHLRSIFATNLADGGRILVSDPFRETGVRLMEMLEAEAWGVTCSRWDMEAKTIGVFELVPPS